MPSHQKTLEEGVGTVSRKGGFIGGTNFQSVGNGNENPVMNTIQVYTIIDTHFIRNAHMQPM